jgi:methylmalonyl-CoA mutase N-terminal domain/subunit
VADPLGGSYYVEALTDEIEQGALQEIAAIEGLGGAAKAIEYMQNEIQEAAYRFQMEIESGERSVVGVNAYVDEEESPVLGQPDFSALARAQTERLGELKGNRASEPVARALGRLSEAARSSDNLLPPMIEAVKADVTLGEISDALREEWGTYDG